MRHHSSWFLRKRMQKIIVFNIIANRWDIGKLAQQPLPGETCMIMYVHTLVCPYLTYASYACLRAECFKFVCWCSRAQNFALSPQGSLQSCLNVDLNWIGAPARQPIGQQPTSTAAGGLFLHRSLESWNDGCLVAGGQASSSLVIIVHLHVQQCLKTISRPLVSPARPCQKPANERQKKGKPMLESRPFPKSIVYSLIA